MNLFGTLQVYGGGPGSGCNPAVGTCGRHPGSGAGATELLRKAFFPKPPKKGRQFNPKNVGGFFRKGTQIAKMYQTLAAKDGEWHKISDFQKEFEGSKFADVMERLTNIRRVGRKFGMWRLDIDTSNDRVKMMLTKKVGVTEQKQKDAEVKNFVTPPAGSGASETEQKLTSGNVIASKELGDVHVNEVYLVKLDNGMKAVWKPGSDTDSGGRKNIKGGKVIQREVGAYEVAKVVGMTDMVPAAVERKHNGELGVMAQFVPGGIAANQREDEKYDGDKDLSRAAVFDFVIGNEDRHAGNWLVDNGKLHLIDHGLTFPEKPESFLFNARFINRASERFRDASPEEYARPYIDNKEKIAATLSRVGLRQKSIDGVTRRIDFLAGGTTWYKMTAIGQGRARW